MQFPRRCQAGGPRPSDALINEPREEARINEEVAVERIEGLGRLRVERFLPRHSLHFQRRDVVPNTDQHIAPPLQLRSIAGRGAVARDDYGFVRCGSEVGVRGRYHAVDTAAGGVVYEWIDPVPEGVAG